MGRGMSFAFSILHPGPAAAAAAAAAAVVAAAASQRTDTTA